MNKQFVLLNMLLGLSIPALAHTGIGASHGFMAGFGHPWQGLDHLLVMIAIGLWASVMGGQARWLLPLSFLLLMAVGAGLEFAGFYLPYAELGVAGSVLLLGLVLGFNWQPSRPIALSLSALFAVSHGSVHTAEIAADQGQLPYMLGFLLTTALLHGIGLSAGLLKNRTIGVVRVTFGLLGTVLGLVLLAN
jgi:urease accessory protein